MVMTPKSDFGEESCSPGSVLSVTSPSCSSATTDNVSFFGDEEISLEDLDLASMMTPLIKGELKESICKRLVQSGKEVPDVEFRTSREEQLTAEEEERRRIRRVRNKLAAQKCRSKKKEKADQLEQEAEKLEDRRDELQTEVERLKREREILQDMLDAHEPFCRIQRARANSDLQLYLNNDHTYTLTDVDPNDNNNSTVPSWSDVEIE